MALNAEVIVGCLLVIVGIGVSTYRTIYRRKKGAVTCGPRDAKRLGLLGEGQRTIIR